MIDQPAPHRIPTDIHIAGLGLVLREWHDHDLPAMVALFDDPEVDRFTPLRSPFDLDAASPTSPGRASAEPRAASNSPSPPTDNSLWARSCCSPPTDAELAYAVGPRHRRRRLATRAVQLITTHARTYLGVRHILLRIPEQKTASAAVARAAVAPPTTREGARDLRRTWQHRP
ncbi:GNAT family N-acetyltransferase [Actinacidiphila glaucinigra]|uniref:GNAT family N-acetyltransferase n=1 Tax=Actinacidiphila glaucinigra TaxID=235986 RepID=UPI003D8A6831